MDSRVVSEERCDVAVVGAGLVGLSLAYELACLGASVTVIDAGHPGRATDAGAGILSPVTSMETRVRDCGRSCARRASTTRPCWRGWHPTASTSAGTGYGRCGILSIGLREHEDEWFAPFADLVLRRAPERVAEITPEEASSLFPPLGPVHRVLHAPGSARVDGRGMAAALRAGGGGPWRARSSQGAAHGVVAGAEPARHGRHVDAVEVEGHQNVACGAVAVAGGAWTAAAGEWLGTRLPVGPTKGQIVHLGVGAETREWPIVQPLLTHYLVPWPGGRVACGGTFESGAGFSVSVTAAGLHELLRECLTVAPGTGGRRPTSRPGSGSGPPRPTIAPSWAGCRAGATPGWRRDTAPTACCRVRSRPGCWRTPSRASPCRRTRRRCRPRSIPGVSADPLP